MLGQDLIIRFGLTNRRNNLETGHYNIFKIFGPTAAAARAMGLDPGQTHQALAIAFTHAVGDGQCGLDGSLSLRLQQGIVAQGALLSCLLARRGFSGAENFLLGRFGYLVAYEPEPRLEYLTEDLGKYFWGERISIKPYSSCRLTHQSIHLALNLAREKKTDPAQVEKIEVKTNPGSYKVVAQPHDFRARPDSVVSAQFSIQYTVAAALFWGDFFLKELDPKAWTDEQVLDLANRVRVVPDEALQTGTSLGRTVMTVEMRDGSVIQNRTDHALGSPELPMSYRACAEKLLKCAAVAARPPDRRDLEELIDKVSRLEELDDAAELMEYLEG